MHEGHNQALFLRINQSHGLGLCIYVVSHKSSIMTLRMDAENTD